MPSAPSRALRPDRPRLVSLFGIVVVDISPIAVSTSAGIDEPAVEIGLDLVPVWFLHGLAPFKTSGLSSVVFGAGLGFMMRSRPRQGLTFRHHPRCRINGLQILCTARACLMPLGSRIRLLHQSRMAAAPKV